MTTESTSVASCLDLLFTRDENNNITTKLYDKRDAFGFHIVNFPFMTSNIPSVLSHIESIFGMEVPKGRRHQSHTWLRWKLVAMATRVKLCNFFVLRRIEFIFGIEIPLDNRQQPHTSLLW